MTVTISPTIARQFLQVRDTGETNMFKTHRVQAVAASRDFNELVLFIEEDSKRLGALVFGDASVEMPDGETMDISEYEDEHYE